ncbi:hypothetical protein M1328_00595 [Patescibacteria group bacterium]|nr:hypothetical protein [Patescibacteria group bacterium]
MGKVKTRLLGMEEVEEKQKKEQKEKAAQKKTVKNKTEAAEPVKTESVSKAEIKKTKSSKKVAVIAKSRGKLYQEAKKLVDKNKTYTLAEATGLLKKMKTADFDQSVELHFVVDETGLKGEVDLPFSTGKTVKIAIVDDKILSEIEKGKINFDMLVTNPSYMPKLARFAKILGPKGLMPNPKAGTISPNPEELVKKFAKGLLRWKTEPKAPLIHQMIGKMSMADKELIANAEKFFDAVGRKHVLKAYLKSTMSPSIKLNL